jgi:hypothetical protein
MRYSLWPTKTGLGIFMILIVLTAIVLTRCAPPPDPNAVVQPTQQGSTIVQLPDSTANYSVDRYVDPVSGEVCHVAVYRGYNVDIECNGSKE